MEAIVLEDILTTHSVISFVQPREFVPVRSEDESLWLIEDPELGVNVYGADRDELFAELTSQLRMLWEEYALERDDALTASALALKRRLLDAFRETATA